jgi:hypothetical protein
VVFSLTDRLHLPEVVAVSSSGRPVPSSPCTADNLMVTCLIGDMPANAQVIYRIAGIGVGHSGDDVPISAVVSHNRADSDPTDDTAAADIPLIAPGPGPTGGGGSGGGGSGGGSGGGGSGGGLPWTGAQSLGAVVAAAVLGLIGLGMVLVRRRLRS